MQRNVLSMLRPCWQGPLLIRGLAAASVHHGSQTAGMERSTVQLLEGICAGERASLAR